MADKARVWTDKELDKMERDISKIYSQAEKELTEKWNAYMERGEKRLSSLQNDYMQALASQDNTIITESQKRLQDAKRAYTLQNEQYQTMVKSVTKDMAQVNQQALSYISGKLPEIYAENYEQVKDVISDIGMPFDIVDKGTVMNMIKEGDVKLPKKKVKIPKDMAWNTKKINSSVLQGIIQGESMQKIAKRLLPIVDSNKKAAIRNARTIVTGVENRGRLDSYKKLEEQGVILKKVWLATGDGRTRDWHIDMDGQEVDLKESFIDGLGNELEYPGDPGGSPETVYNCRCSMITDIVGFKMPDGSISYVERYDEESSLHDEEMSMEARRRNAYSYIGKPLSRPRQSDYGGYTEEYERAKDTYRKNRDTRSARAENWYKNNVNTNPMSIDELKEWCSNHNCKIYGDLDGLDGVSLRNYTERYEKLSKDFPIVEKFHEKIGRPFEIAYNPNGMFDAEASHGMTFGRTYSDFHQTFTNSVISSDGIGFVMGENPAVRTFDHEFGHQVYDALKYGNDKIPFNATIEEIDRRTKMKNDFVETVYGKTGMSEYATTNDDELFAEAFCAWYGGEKTEFAKSFGRFLKRWIK